MNDTLNKSLICGHEGLRLKKYKDSRGFWTIGRGFNLEAQGAAAVCAKVGVDYAAVMAGAAITLAQANAIFDSQYASVAGEARAIFPAVDTFPDNAGAVICDMLFELGLTKFLKFHNTDAAFGRRDWHGAIAGIEDSKYASEVPGRVANNVALLGAICA